MTCWLHKYCLHWTQQDTYERCFSLNGMPRLHLPPYVSQPNGIIQMLMESKAGTSHVVAAAQHLCGEGLRRGDRLQSRQLCLDGSEYCVQHLLGVLWYLHCSSINPCCSSAYAPTLMGL